MHKMLLFISLVVSLQIWGQETRTISGYIMDKASGELLVGAGVYDAQHNLFTATNEYGFFSLTTPNTTTEIYVRLFSYNETSMLIDKGNQQLNIYLSRIQEFEDVDVIGEKNATENGEVAIDFQLESVEKLPMILGERDVFRVMQLLPGVKSGGEASSGLYVRGGSPDQNLILLDGVPVYNASHLFGFFSVFNSDALSNVKLIKGGFPARYGGRASSVIDIRLKEGNMRNFNMEGSLGLISSKLLIEGPIIEDKLSFAVSGRRTYLDILASPFIAAFGNGAKAGYFFHDYNAKMQYKINERHRLFLSGYFGKDKVYVEDRYTGSPQLGNGGFEDVFAVKMQWGNEIGALRWNYQISPKLFKNTTVTYSNYKFETGVAQSYYEVNNAFSKDLISSSAFGMFSGVQDWGIRSDFNYRPNNKHTIRFGAYETYHTFRPGQNYLNVNNAEEKIDSISGSSSLYSHELGAYIEDEFKITNRLSVNAGFHFALLHVNRTNYFAPQPRINAKFDLNEKSYLRAGASRMTQFLHLLSNSGIGLPTDLWLPATEQTRPIEAHQVDLGFVTTPRKGWLLSIDGYYKKLDNLIQYKEGTSFLMASTDWQERITVGEGWAYGAEVFLEKKVGKWTGWGSYTLSWSERQFQDLNQGRRFFHRYDQRHNLSIALTYAHNKKWDFGMVFVYGTGNALTLPTQLFSSSSHELVTSPATWGGIYDQIWDLSSFDEMNGYRMPSYHRLDLSANRTKEKKHGTSILSFSIYNVYNRQNPFMLYPGRNSDGNPALMQVALFPIIPSISWNFKFDLTSYKKAQHE